MTHARPQPRSRARHRAAPAASRRRARTALAAPGALAATAQPAVLTTVCHPHATTSQSSSPGCPPAGPRDRLSTARAPAAAAPSRRLWPGPQPPRPPSTATAGKAARSITESEYL